MKLFDNASEELIDISRHEQRHGQEPILPIKKLWRSENGILGTVKDGPHGLTLFVGGQDKFESESIEVMEALADARDQDLMTGDALAEMLLDLAKSGVSEAPLYPLTPQNEEESFRRHFEGFLKDVNDLRKCQGHGPLSEADIESLRVNQRRWWGL